MLNGLPLYIIAGLAGLLVGLLVQRWLGRREIVETQHQNNQALEAAEREMERLAKDWKTYQQQVRDVQAAGEQLKQKNADLETELEEMAAKHELALRYKDEELSAVREKFAAAENKFSSLLSRENLVSQTESRLRQEDDALRAEILVRDERIRELDEHLNQMAPLLAEVSQLRNQASEMERRVKKAETELTERDAELALMRTRMAELEPMPALLVDRDTRLRDQEQRQRGVIAALEARVEDYEAMMQKMENRLAGLAQMESELASARARMREADQQSAKLLEERGAEIRGLKQRIAELEAGAGRDADYRLQDAIRRAEAAEVKVRGLETRQEVLLTERDQKIAVLESRLAEPKAMAASAGAGAGGFSAGSATFLPGAHAAPPRTTTADHQPQDPGPARLHGRLQELLFLRPIDFAPGTCELEVSAAAVLDEIAVLIRATPGVSLVVVEGHTDAHGDPYLNWTLSYWRAEAVRRYMAQRGIAEGMMRAVGHGGSRPLADNETEDGRARNRRIEIRIMGGASRHTMEA